MGVHNRITQQKYTNIKKAIKQDDAGKYAYIEDQDRDIGKRFGVSKTTIRNIRNTDNYQTYCEKIFRFHGHPRTKHISEDEVVECIKTDELDTMELASNGIEWKRFAKSSLVMLIITLLGLIIVEGIIIFFLWRNYVV